MPTMTQTVNSDTAGIPLGRRWGWLLALGVVEIIAGCVAIAVPLIASLAAVAIFGSVLLVTAVFQLAHAIQVRAWPRSMWYLLGGVLYAVAALLILAYPLGGALTLTVLIATLLFADGVLRTALGILARRAAGSGWVLAGGIASILLGVLLLLSWPASALWATGLLLGVNLVFSGVTRSFLALELKASRHA